MADVIHAAFSARPILDPPSTAVQETAETVANAVHAGGAVYATVADRPAGVILMRAENADLVSLHRVSVSPEFQRHGVASAMVAAVQDYAAERGFTEVELFAREELGDLVDFWRHRGYSVRRPAPYGMILGARLPVALRVPTAAAMRALGEQLAELLRAADLVILSGELGAGKTTLTQGVGTALGAEGAVISPTFVLSRVHPTPAGRPDLVHVDAYRLTSAAELDDLDLDAQVTTAVTVVEWGEGLAEGLAADRLEIDIRDAGRVDHGDHADPNPAGPVGAAEPADLAGATDRERTVLVRGVGERWRSVDLTRLRPVAVAGG